MSFGIVERWSKKVQRLRGRGFLDSAMAAAALVATADRDVRLSEQLALDELLGRLDALRLHDAKTGVEIHRRYAEGIGADPKAGAASAMASVAKMAGKADEAMTVLYVAGAIARADGDLSDPEQRVLADIAEALDVSFDDSVAEIWTPEITEA